MNQIIFNKKRNKIKYIFKVQFIISIVVAIIIFLFLKIDYNEEENLEKLSKIINKNLNISSMYDVEKQSIKKVYFGKIYIEKINLEYAIFNNFNEELLKISPCKFYGGNLDNKGNICIAGHNYNDERFFGNLDKLEIKDEIILENLDGKRYKYIIFDIFETDENDISIFNSSKKYELTLLTCNNANKKRIIIKAYRKQLVQND